jgi:NADPH:quinone reductase-like Zn-dependent oxidoreductase
MAMKAIVHDVYGAPDVLQLKDIERPTIGHSDVLVRVRAAALHIGDCFAVRGTPFPVRFMTGLLRPKLGIPGFDVAGQVEAIGSSVTGFKPGDEVFGACDGACAEYARAAADKLVRKPSNLSFEQAASIPTSALAALHGLRDAAKLQPGQRVLINGASGGVGTFAIQIAKHFGAEVTGVCSTANIELVRALGAEHAIDYTQEDFTRHAARYDVILDNIENRSLAECRRALTPEGTLVLNSGTGARGFAMLVRLMRPLMLAPFVRHKLRRPLSMPKHADIATLQALAAEGKLRPVIDRVYTLSEVPEALRYLEKGHARGKVVVSVRG